MNKLIPLLFVLTMSINAAAQDSNDNNVCVQQDSAITIGFFNGVQTTKTEIKPS